MAEHRLLPLYHKGEIVAHAKIDAADFDEMAKYRWFLDLHTGYAVRTEKHYLHREIMGLVKGDGVVVDHRDGDPLDCRHRELRLCPRGQLDNCQNYTKLSKRNKSGYRGVSWHKPTRKWRALVRIGGTDHLVGYFDDAAEAGEAAARFRAEHMSFATN